jgi:hypothetical protein
MELLAQPRSRFAESEQGDAGPISQQHNAPVDQMRIRQQSSASSENLLSLIDEAFVSSPSSESLLRPPSQELDTFDTYSRLLIGLASYVSRNRFIIGVIASWYLLGVVAIVSTKLLLMEWSVPPLFLTFQQLVLASSLLRLRLAAFSRGGAQPMPVLTVRLRRGKSASDNDSVSVEDSTCLADGSEHSNESASFLTTEGKPSNDVDENDDNTAPLDFYLAGLFNCMDFLASNTAFSASTANFVETIKASDPITTTTVALVYGVDRLGLMEAGSLVLLVSGILLSTWGNGGSDEHGYHRALQGLDTTVILSWEASVRSALLVVVANFSFAFRAMTQKLYQRHARVTLNDDNLLFRLQQVGWMTLLVPVLVVYCGTLRGVLAITEHKLDYAKLSLVNAIAYATYK